MKVFETLFKFLVPKFLLISGGCLLALMAFIEITENVLNNDVVALDQVTLRQIQAPLDGNGYLQSALITDFARDITALGSPGVLVIITVITCGFLLTVKQYRTALFIGASTLSGGLILGLLKFWFNRPRPAPIPQDLFVNSTSFPSGHAMGSTLVFLTIAVLLTRIITNRTSKIYVLIVAFILSGLIGLSRVYLGIHWPSDVAAGWAAGMFWALLWWGCADFMEIDKGKCL